MLETRCECGVVNYGSRTHCCVCGRPFDKPAGSLPDSIRILGIPWRVVLTDSLDGDGPASVVYADKYSSTLELSDTLEPIRLKYHLFWGLLVAIQSAIIPPEVRPEPEDNDAFHAAMWIALRDNWEVVFRWFPAEGEPLVEPTSALRLHGTVFRLERPKLVPGEGRHCMGQSRAEERVIFTQMGLGPWQAAQTALHELMHAAVQRFSPLGNSEVFVEAVSAVLAQVLFDNPQAMRWLFEGEATADGPE